MRDHVIFRNANIYSLSEYDKAVAMSTVLRCKNEPVAAKAIELLLGPRGCQCVDFKGLGSGSEELNERDPCKTMRPDKRPLLACAEELATTRLRPSPRRRTRRATP